MLHRLSFAPFPDAAAATWFADLGDALEADGATGLLLANLAASGTTTLAAVAVLPGRVVVLQPATNPPGAIFPIGTTMLEQQTALANWLNTWPELPPVPAAAIAGFTLALDSAIAPAPAGGWPGTTLAALPRQLRQLPAELPLPAALLDAWAADLTADDSAPTEEAETADYAPEDSPAGFWEHKARQLWNWLGAADVPADPPYGAPAAALVSPPDAAAEQRRLEQLRAQVFEELAQQRRQMEAREATREQSIAQLRQQLAATPSAAAEVAALQARLAAETQEKNTLAAAIAASRQEAEARNRALEARMQQLGQQLATLQTPPKPAPAALAAAPKSPNAAAATGRTRRAAATVPTATGWQLQWPRVALVLGLLAAVGVGGWGVQHYARQPSGAPASRPARNPEADNADANADENLEAAAPTLFDIQPDTVQVETEPVDTEETLAPELPAPQPEETMDSVVAPAEGI